MIRSRFALPALLAGPALGFAKAVANRIGEFYEQHGWL